MDQCISQQGLDMLDFPDSHEDPSRSDRSDALQGIYKKAAVVSNSEHCAVIGREILEKGGSAVDGLIGTMLCEGLCAMQNMGVGGGCFMTLYSKKARKVSCLNAREKAPELGTKDMFNGRHSIAAKGGLSVGVPGELMGYWEAHQKYGRLPWKELFQPAIRMCLDGVPINRRLGRAFSDSRLGHLIKASPSLMKVLGCEDCLPGAGDRIRLPILAKTFKTIADSPIGAMELYDGSLTSSFIRDLESLESVMTTIDMKNYRAIWMDPMEATLSGGLRMFSSPLPGCGCLLIFILQLLDGILGQDPTYNIVAVSEAFKHAYAVRSELGDPENPGVAEVLERIQSRDYIKRVRNEIRKTVKTSNNPRHYGAKYDFPRDKGTCNIVVVAPDGDVAIATSTINTLFGSLIASESTGIILNNEMDDFSSPNIINSFGLPPSEANFVAPGRRPLSSSCPTIILDQEGELKLAAGASGGTHITTSTAQAIMNNLWFNTSIKRAVDMPRLHHQLYPMMLQYERGISSKVLSAAKAAGHELENMGPKSAVTAVARNDNLLTAIYDFRKGGSTAGF